MGHERLGILPRRKNWNVIVDDIRVALGGDSNDTSILVSNTLHIVRDRYRKIFLDTGVQAAFGYLIALSTSDLRSESGFASAPIDLDKNPSIFKITSELSKWVASNTDSNEYGELASRAAADAIACWYRQNSKQQNLFDEEISAHEIWSNVDGRSFCTISRTFFAKFTERYMKYFIERSASAQTSSVGERDKFQKVLSAHIDAISQHAFETSVITQSFSAGWFNKNAKVQRPTDKQIIGFLSKAFSKLQEELSREDLKK